MLVILSKMLPFVYDNLVDAACTHWIFGQCLDESPGICQGETWVCTVQDWLDDPIQPV